MSTVVTRYLNNVGNTAGGDGSADTTSGSTRAFNSYVDFESWLYTNYASLVTSDVQVDLYCKGIVENLGSTLTIRSTLDATRYIQVIGAAGHRHAGVYDANKVGISNGIANVLASSGGMYMRFDGFQLKTGNGFRRALAVPTATSGDVQLSNMVLHTTAIGESSVGPIIWDGSTGTRNLRMANVIISGPWDSALNLDYLTNCILRKVIAGGTNRGFVINYTTSSCDLKEVVVTRKSGAAGTCFTLTSNTGQTTARCVSDDATSPTSGMRNLTPTYTNAGAFNFEPTTADTVLVGQGADMSADGVLAVSTDIRGTAFASPYALGPFQVVASAGSGFGPLVGSSRNHLVR